MILVKTAKESKLTEQQFNRLYDITNTAYRDTEIEIWGEDYIRISKEDYRKIFEQNEILVAFLNNEVVGGVWHKKISNNIYWFSLLVADFNKNGIGIGRALIQKVEEEAVKKNCSRIRIEILRARGIEVESKKIIHDWYERMGYCYTHSEDFSKIKPTKAMGLVRPGDFDYYLKKLKH